MPEELQYSTVVLKNPNFTSPKEKKEVETLYVEVKARGSSPSQPGPATSLKEGLFLVKDGPPPHSQPFRGVAVCLGVLCVLLVLTSIPFCVYFSTSLSEHNTNLVKELEQLTDDHISLLAANQDLMNLYCKLSEANHILQSDYINVSTENQQLKAERMNLSRDRDGLNWTLGVIFQLKKFPVDNYCPYKDANIKDRECKPCQVGWVLFQSSCYLFLHIKVPFGHLWRTWQGSRQHCKNNNADLVDIDSQEEQAKNGLQIRLFADVSYFLSVKYFDKRNREFILNNTQAYYDEDHGYWIGLTDIAEDGQWLWVDGRHQNLTDGFWKRQPVWGRDCALTNPNNAPLANWNAASCGQRNRWICESRALIWSG